MTYARARKPLSPQNPHDAFNDLSKYAMSFRVVASLLLRGLAEQQRFQSHLNRAGSKGSNTLDDLIERCQDFRPDTSKRPPLTVGQENPDGTLKCSRVQRGRDWHLALPARTALSGWHLGQQQAEEFKKNSASTVRSKLPTAHYFCSVSREDGEGVE